MMWRIDPGGDEPLYAQLVTQVRLAVAHGELRPGERLPAARELAASLDLNMHTVLRAYQLLRDDGVVELRRGRGAMVAARQPADLTAVERAIADLVDAARRAHLSTETTTTLVKEAMHR
ncbi:GntR family transcriptional regulator [Isoptericola sp. NEAU-Y5]|uniref:GntR family transcriptional regulator n=1 Tax=Isoptericola luteus TaxID=2879484 RepID=A0ABS7ZFM6_9MICO|nr:GntR family transcriptional regulator [Isoptericola sp. NEAU-Y5]MCA5893317.1 GntR family transcriptional regulator [Isoptericola sp. NEAU-Y5]